MVPAPDEYRSMIKVTDSAKEELKRILERSSLEAGKYLRLATPPVWVGEGDFGVVVDAEGDGDKIVDFQGSKVLLVDAGLAEGLGDAVLDYKDFPDGPRFTLDVF